MGGRAGTEGGQERVTGAATDWWEPARRKALAQADEDYRYRNHLPFGFDMTIFHGGCKELDAKRAAIMHPDWLPSRPGRRMPSLWKIVQHWAQKDTFAPHPIALPACFACCSRPPGNPDDTPEDAWNNALGYLERAHLVDRVRGGLDGPQNLAPLCHACHKVMPPFDVGEGAQAIEWVRAGGRIDLESAHRAWADDEDWEAVLRRGSNPIARTNTTYLTEGRLSALGYIPGGGVITAAFPSSSLPSVLVTPELP